MIRLICGPKGTGKTKIILEEIARSVDVAKGDIVFITDKKKDYARGISFNVRVLYTDDFGVDCPIAFGGFVKGLMAGNSDIEYLYVDGLTKIIGDDCSAIADFLKTIVALEKEYNLNAVITVSKLKEELPEEYRAFTE
ncbi:MAG: hypothetical protein J5762_03605 [Clostridia bacterium]|nr:hypothetical protein [Clostridia bacterium]